MRYLPVLASVAFIAMLPPAYAGKGGTHTDTDLQHRTVTQEHNTTKTHTVHQRNDVEDVTHVQDVTRVHPVHHVTDVTRYVHHVVRKDENEYATHRNVAPEQVEHTHSTEQVGHAAQPREHTVTHYHDVYQDDYSTRVHEVTGTPVIDRYIHRHVTDVTVQPVVHEHDVTRVVLDNHYVKHTTHEPVQVAGSARTIVRHKREDVDP